MNELSLLDEVYAARQSLWDEAGGTLEGLFKYFKEHPIHGVHYTKLPIAKPRRCPRTMTRKATSRKKTMHLAKR